ncbi:hypothetical protein [Silvibacterium acidisoli]|uniref:hypothetical protein n=1 Tax=Acidobacteriaceae bacterium ZG23-2 TaxID=2883246 RepID=UPI00406C4F35
MSDYKGRPGITMSALEVDEIRANNAELVVDREGSMLVWFDSAMVFHNPMNATLEEYLRLKMGQRVPRLHRASNEELTSCRMSDYREQRGDELVERATILLADYLEARGWSCWTTQREDLNNLRTIEQTAYNEAKHGPTGFTGARIAGNRAVIRAVLETLRNAKQVDEDLLAKSAEVVAGLRAEIEQLKGDRARLLGGLFDRVDMAPNDDPLPYIREYLERFLPEPQKVEVL